eukprot:GFUD01006469.1.p1 GENE.GFUD01006469.1~~GFUD01006469.1.p1  ORF type:complete len:449 (+),score=119.14 GFUD01006469.1:71-1417(+)
MTCTNRLRRRISKKWLTIAMVCGLVDCMAFLMYWKSHQPSSFTIRERLVHEVDVIFAGDPGQVSGQVSDQVDGQVDAQVHAQVPGQVDGHSQVQDTNVDKQVQVAPADYSPQIDGLLPKEILDNFAGPPKKLEALKSAVKHKNKESAMLDRMEKSLLREAKQSEQEISRLPKPGSILAESQGPVHRIVSPPKPGLKNAKLLVIARENTGYPVLGQFFNKKNGFFEHGEPPHELHMISNLLNCVLTPELIETFPEHIKTDFGKSLYFTEDCLLDSHTVCNDPLSYETACSNYPHQILHSKHFSLKFAKQLLKVNEDLKIIFLVRDPRGILRNTSSKPQKSCNELSQDLDEALSLLSEFPKQFSLARYEVLAISPLVEVSKLLENLEMELTLASEENMDSSEGWSLHKNSVQKVNSWKQKLSIKELQKIENQCLETLSKLEYQLLGQGVA